MKLIIIYAFISLAFCQSALAKLECYVTTYINGMASSDVTKGEGNYIEIESENISFTASENGDGHVSMWASTSGKNISGSDGKIELKEYRIISVFPETSKSTMTRMMCVRLKDS